MVSQKISGSQGGTAELGFEMGPPAKRLKNEKGNVMMRVVGSFDRDGEDSAWVWLQRAG